MNAEALVGLSLLLPLAVAVAVVLAGRFPNVREAFTVAGAVLTASCVLLLAPRVVSGSRPNIELLTFGPGIALAFEVEPLGMLFAIVASVLWVVTSVYSIGYMRGHHEEHQTRFFACFALSVAAALGVAFARNLITLFVFYEFLTLSTYPLVTHHGTEEARRAGRTYIGILLSTSIGFLLLAIAWTYRLAGSVEFVRGGILPESVPPGSIAVLLGLFAFGTGKAALMPVHRWLPAAMVAPTPVSALLHAVAVVKAGVFTVLKVVVYIFGIERLSRSDLSLWLMYAASFTIVAASVIAFTKDDLKARLAYSTVGQLAYIVLGAALATPESVAGGALHIVMHATGKITLFFCAGAILVATNKTRVSELDGVGRRMPLTMAAFLMGALSIVGLPPFGGAWSKWHLALGSAQGHGLVFMSVLVLSSLLSLGYLVPIAARAFFLPAKEEGESIAEAPVLCLIPLCATAAGCIALFFYTDALLALIAPVTGSPP